jgi:coatomer subunit beta
MSGEVPCHYAVDTSETPSTQELRSALEKSSDEDKLDTLRRIIVATINSNNPQVSIHAPDFPSSLRY